MKELIAGESEHHKAGITIRLMQVFKRGELRSEAALCGGVHDKHDLARIRRKRDGFALRRGKGVMIERGHILAS